MTTLASSNFGPPAASSCVSTRLAFFSSSGTVTSTETTFPEPPLLWAAKAFGRAMINFGFGPDSWTSTIWVPPKIWVWA